MLPLFQRFQRCVLLAVMAEAGATTQFHSFLIPSLRGDYDQLDTSAALPGTYFIGAWGGLRSEPDGLEKTLISTINRNTNRGFPAHDLVNAPPTPFRVRSVDFEKLSV